jgi:uncharacterized protein (DUF2062 family)
MSKRFCNHWLLRHLPSAESIRQSRLLQPLAHYLDHHALWQFNRRSVAGGLAIGLFFSVALPAMQMPVAAMIAILFKVNIPVAALATLLSNPFTTPLILYMAYQVGSMLTGQSTAAAADAAYAHLMAAHDVSIAGAMSWLADAYAWMQAAGLPLAIGLAIISLGLMLVGYFGASLTWRLRTQLRWRTRLLRRRQAQQMLPL